jgi:hypothetical protein
MGSCEHEEIVSELRERRESDEKGLVPENTRWAAVSTRR